jgi:hypothetical protein
MFCVKRCSTLFLHFSGLRPRDVVDVLDAEARTGISGDAQNGVVVGGDGQAEDELSLCQRKIV